MATFLAVASLGATASAEQAPEALDPRPDTGTFVLGGGIALSVVGAASMVTSALCETSIVIPEEQSPCFSVSFLVGAPVLAAGITLTVVGVFQRIKYHDWMRRHPALRGLDFAATSRGAEFAYTLRF
jgi:hypothetical protein